MTRTSAAAFAALLLAMVQPVAAQESPSAEEATAVSADRWSILVEEPDPCLEARAAAGPDTIVVCEERSDPEQYKAPIEREVDGDRGMPRAPNVFGIPPCESYQFCGKFGKVPPPAIMVDFDALPETPEGSAAARWGGPTTASETAEPAAPPVEEPNVAKGLADDVVGP